MGHDTEYSPALLAALRTCGLHIPHQPFLIGENKVQPSISSCCFLCHLDMKIIISAFQGLPDLLMP